MKRLKWLVPGMKIKRWIMLCAVSIILISMGFVITIFETNPQTRTGASLIIIAGILGVVTGIKRIIKSVVTIFLPEREEDLVDIVYKERYLARGANIAVIGGGTGLSTLLHGMKEYTSNITAIVTVADDGGSSGRLRQEFNVLPPGDIRNCLVALADAELLMGKLFQFRFEDGEQLKGHNFGNLFITAMTKVTGDFEQALKESSRVLAIRGQVLPATLSRVTLCAEHQDGERTAGESKIPHKGTPIKKVYLEPHDCRATEDALRAIRGADAIVIGPGSLYTSILPTLLVNGITREIARTQVIKIYVCNVMTQPGETDNYKASDHVHALIGHTAANIMTHCIVNIASVPERMKEKYALEKAYPVIADKDAIKAMDYTVIGANVIDAKDFVRHDPRKVAGIIINTITEHSRKGMS